VPERFGIQRFSMSSGINFAIRRVAEAVDLVTATDMNVEA
jgi:hypothetical protein